MDTRQPIAYYAELSDEHLRIIAVQLLDVRHATLREMNSPYDDNYTHETAVFGRQKNMLIGLAMSGTYDWMSLKHAGMDVTFNIGKVPCRFFTDDPKNPEKAGFFKRNAVDDLFSTDDQQPVMWRFVVEKALTDDDEDRVYFIGYNVFQERVSTWMYRASMPMLHVADKAVPSTVEIGPADVDVREDEVADDGDIAQAGSDR